MDTYINFFKFTDPKNVQEGGCGCGGIPVYTSTMRGGSSGMEKEDTCHLSIPGGLVCVPTDNDANDFTNSNYQEIAEYSDNIISDSLFDQLLGKVSAPLPEVFRQTLHIVSGKSVPNTTKKHRHTLKEIKTTRKKKID